MIICMLALLGGLLFSALAEVVYDAHCRGLDRLRQLEPVLQPSVLQPSVLQPSITCPRCGRTSYNPNDIREGYCGNCHDWTSAKAVEIVFDPQLLDYNAKGWWPFDRVPK